MTFAIQDAAAAWQSRAIELQVWTSQRLVNRTDLWGCYRREPERKIVQAHTSPNVDRRLIERLDGRTIRRHFAATSFGHIIGLHAGSPGPESTAKWIAGDIDQHDNDEPCSEFNLRAAIHFYERGLSLGFRPLVTSSNGRGGYHVRVLLAEAIPLDLAWRFARWFFRDAADYGVQRIEIFPKQSHLAAAPAGDEARKSGAWRNAAGNWLRLPGRHHKREHYSAVWAGDETGWLFGHAAIDCLISHNGDAVDLIPAEAKSYDGPTRIPPVASRPAAESPNRSHVNDWTPSARAGSYASAADPAIEGQGGHNHTLKLTWNVLRGFNLTVAEALEALQAWNSTCSPPWTDAALVTMLEGANAAPGDRGWLLADRERNSGPAKVDGCSTDPEAIAWKIPVNPSVDDQIAALAAEFSTPQEHAEYRDATLAATAAECRAEECRAHRPEATTCHVHGFLYHPEKKQVRAARFACGRWCCVRCSRALKELWAPHLEKKVLETKAESVYVATLTLTPNRWSTIRRSLHRAGAEFARINTSGLEFMVVATKAFAGSLKTSTAAAAAAVVTTVKTLAVYGDTRKPIHTSAGWRLPKEKPSGWRYIGGLDARATKSEIVHAIEAETGTEARQRVNKGNPFFVWAADAAVMIPPDRLEEDNWGGYISRLHQRVSLRLNGEDPDIADMAVDVGLTCRLPLVE